MLNPEDLKETAVTYDDVLLVPQYSEVVPSSVSLETRLTKRIALNIPLMSAPMDTVTEAKMAIALAREGGVGVIHKNLKPEEQARQVQLVKRSSNGVIENPVTVTRDVKIREVRSLMDANNISGIPVVEEDGTLEGIVTRRDLRFVDKSQEDDPVASVMTWEGLVRRSGEMDLQRAERVLRQSKVEKLLLVDDNEKLTGLVTIRDVDLYYRYPSACRDSKGRLRVGASVGVRDFDRVEKLIEEHVDFIIVDSAHGHSKNVIDTVSEIKKRWDVDVIAGNVATYDGAKALIDAGADAVKVGIGPGSICTTRVVSGVGMPQLTAISEGVRAAEPSGIPIIADGGIRFSGDVVKALGAGASVVMLGSLFAGCDEAPGELVFSQGRAFKAYRGMGSLGAMKRGSSDRYFQKDKPADKLVPEGVEGRVPYKGAVGPYVYQLVGGIRSGMGYCGAATVDILRRTAKFTRISSATLRENHPHDISITSEAPNYSPSCDFGA
ncbi:MAG: IMP dehydrogenase [Planctomycetia bacterium]|nr:IMP dehydrogenase [Planctomycetia bacterium]